MPTTTTAARVLAALAIAGFGAASLAGCTLVTTLAGNDPAPTTTETAEAAPTTASPDPAETATSTPTTTTTAEEGQLTNYFDLKIGDCFDEPESGSGGEALLYSSCDVPHLYEAYWYDVMTGDATFPGDDAVGQHAETVCREAFQTFVGSNPSSSKFTYQYIVPSQGTWENLNDREILCLVMPKDEQQTTGSAENSRL